MKSLYVHIPFCEKKCFYCSFVVAVGQEKRFNEYLLCLEKESQNFSGTRVQSVFIGGGTPTQLSCSQLEALLGMVHSRFTVENGAEFTVESNPESLDAEKCEFFLKNGVNRLSIGVQSFQDAMLQRLGRAHDAERAVKAFETAREAGFENVSIDLMCGIPGQTPRDLEHDLRHIEALRPDHVSVYSLTVEENSRFFARDLRLNDEETQASHYTFVKSRLNGLGYRQYEVSNYALPGKESLHNINYWTGGDYIGLGVGAHSHSEGARSQNVSRFMDYLRGIRSGKPVTENREHLSPRARLTESVAFHLRMNAGCDLNALEKRFGEKLSVPQREKIEEWLRTGFLTDAGGRLKATDKGQLVLDELCVQLM